MTVYAILAISENNFIGVDGQLPWRLPTDLKWFKMNTNESVVIMGRRTWESLRKRPLPNRLNIVMSRNSGKTNQDGVIWSRTTADAIRCCEAHNHKHCFVIGGAQIYDAFASRVNIWLVTRVHTTIASENPTIYELPPTLKRIWRSRNIKHKNMSFHFEILSK
tara:strand:+ start:9292 stop:9780 length:489 start_codon:yes stop_codon:yes gene_type:complete